ncbi:MAG: tail fiber domain-containing protein [Pyrinomonadaceae bacterium]|nr:tail fiber domain-containing protein [Pyrinomonadaceae bacterium]
MNKFKNLITLFALFFLLGCLSVFAQSTAFSYQGKLNDGASAANGTYQMEFELYDDAGAGSQVGSTVTNNNVMVTNGIFNVEIDFGANAFTGGARYLSVKVKKAAEPTFTTLSPRQPILSTPYAIRSLNATNVETTTAGNSVVNAINDAATNITISDSRLPSNLVRLTPSATQTGSSTDNSDAVLNVTGAKDDGNGNLTNLSNFRFNVDGGFFASGTQSTGFAPTSGAGSRMMWYPGKWAFRAGKVDSFGATYWDESNIGIGSVALGENSRASGNNSFAANLATTASGDESVALGNNGTASGARSFAFNATASGVGAVAIGSGAQATNDDALALGPSSIAGGLASITIGPSIANGSFGVAIGLQNKANGNFSLALGKNAVTCSVWNCPSGTEKQGAVVIGDGCAGFSSDAVTATANNQVNMRGCGGFRFFTNQALTSGVELASGGGSWSSLSDRNMKENFVTVNTREILQKVVTMPVTTWNYKSQDKTIRHIGVTAQDFHAKFGVGESDTRIATIDPDGVAFAAIQGLNEKVEERTNELQKENEALKTQLKQQQATIDALKKLVCATNPEAEVCKQ